MANAIPLDSPLELEWNTVPPGFALLPKRVERFDRKSGLFHAPVSYAHIPITNVSDELPDDTWISNALIDFVRGEFGAGSNRGPCPPKPVLTDCRPMSQRDISSYVEACENDLVYGGLVDSIIRSSGALMTEHIYALLTHSTLGNKENAKNFSHEYLAALIQPLLEKQLRLHFVFPSFPFKDQNPFRTQAPAGHVDFAEIGMLGRLHALALAIFQVHPYGADWVIISDGPAYAPILDIPEDQVMAYRRRLLDFRNLMNLHGTVSILDLKDLTRRISSKEKTTEVFPETVKHIKERLTHLVGGGSPELEQTFAVLGRGMKWNMNHKNVCGSVGWEDLWLVFNAEFRADCPDGLKDLWTELQRRAENAALAYGAFNLALKFHAVIDTLLPNSIRATIHPKRNQIAVPKTGDEYPWNGVGVVSSSRYSPATTSVMALYRLLRQERKIFTHCIHDQIAPFCYSFSA